MARNSTVRVSCRVERQQQQCQITPLHGSSSSSSSNSRNGDSRQNYSNGNHSVRSKAPLLFPDALLLLLLPALTLSTSTALKRLKLKKNNWSSESYRFDKVFTETASQKRVYEAVVKVPEKLIRLGNWAKMMRRSVVLWSELFEQVTFTAWFTTNIQDKACYMKCMLDRNSMKALPKRKSIWGTFSVLLLV
ncbi:hypothetical protein D5086_015712 [Populus alba]|uniref:Uncharacterized protein n=1 Tax=Populus alba TaxID=43335 RepID=A0ACC4BSJ5_POPAL